MDAANADTLATRLLGEFGGIGRIWSQKAEAIERVAGAGSPVVPLLLAVRDAVRETGRAPLDKGRITPESAQLIHYLKSSMGSLPEETLRVLFLDGAQGLIADEQIQSGTIGTLSLYPRVVFRRALELNAAAIILAHNHPSGDPNPSRADILVTDRLVALGRSLDVEVTAHIVVTASEHRCILNTHSSARPKVSADLMSLRSPGGAPETLTPQDDRQIALANARRTARRRLLRRQLLGADALFGEPAWDMLIELFIHQGDGNPVATSSLCVGTDLSMSSALRLVQRLIDAGLIFREVDPDDGRRHFIYLSPEVDHRLTAFFAEHHE